MIGDLNSSEAALAAQRQLQAAVARQIQGRREQWGTHTDETTPLLHQQAIKMEALAVGLTGTAAAAPHDRVIESVPTAEPGTLHNAQPIS
jgi:hypothetical protein